jgi:hypothetical protein
VEINLSLFRTLAFAILLSGFFVWLHYSDVHGGPSYVNARYASRVLGYCGIVFTSGAFFACFADYQYGLFPPKSLRPLIIVGGISLMILAVAIIYHMQHADPAASGY